MNRAPTAEAGPRTGAAPPGMAMPPGMMLPQRRKVLIMVTVMLALFLAALDQTIYSVAAPKAVGDLGRLDLFAWPVTTYLLGSTVLVPIIGKMSDIYGRKPFLLVGVVIFLIGSALCGASGSMWQLIGFRLVQGFGAAFIMANAFTVMGDYFAPSERARWAGIIAATFATASIAGPLVGGVLTDELSWRWVFYVNIPVGGAALVSILAVMPNYKGAAKQSVDWTGGLLLILAATPLLLALSVGGTEVGGLEIGWGDSPVVIPVIVSAVAVLLFILVGRRKGEAGIMPIPMFKNRAYLLCTLVMVVIGVGLMGTMFTLPFFLQGAQGISATNSGLVTLPSSIGIVAGSVITGQVMHRTGSYKPIAVIAGFGVVCALFLLSQMTVDTNLWSARGFMFLMGISMGSLMPLYTLVLQNSLPFTLLGAGTAANQFFRQIGAAAGVAVFGTLIATNFASRLGEMLGAGVPARLREDPAWLLSTDSLAQLRQEMGAAAEPLIETARVALAGPVTDTFFYAAAILIASIVIGILLPRMKFRTAEDMMAEARAGMAARAGAGRPRPAAAPASPNGAPALPRSSQPAPAAAAADIREPRPVPRTPRLRSVPLNQPVPEPPWRRKSVAATPTPMRAIALWAQQALAERDWARN